MTARGPGAAGLAALLFALCGCGLPAAKVRVGLDAEGRPSIDFDFARRELRVGTLYGQRVGFVVAPGARDATLQPVEWSPETWSIAWTTDQGSHVILVVMHDPRNEEGGEVELLRGLDDPQAKRWTRGESSFPEHGTFMSRVRAREVRYLLGADGEVSQLP